MTTSSLGLRREGKLQMDTKDIEEDYNEEEDLDFDPSKRVDVDNDSDGEAVVDDDEQGVRVNYSNIESESGGLVKTRRARELEEINNRKNKYEGLASSVSQRANELWAQLKLEADGRLATNSNGSVLAESKPEEIVTGEEMITIERTYKFAGETIREKKTVPISSAEAVEYLNNLKFQTESKKETAPSQEQQAIKEQNRTKNDTEVDRTKLRRPLKRPPILEQIISGSLKPKLSTLEKSKLDWATYVDKEGINDELNAHNKDGYLAKQDFLNKVDSVKEQEYRDMRRKEMAMRLEAQK
ncbi:SWR1-complex protein 5 [Nakaseomyces bracarensis]|uniref:SWR1-complex protein 5 n=1 Tax=Nakaseomyces bracarensis TaxID=273131 RepID=A0ABR4NMS2_9SACH